VKVTRVAYSRGVNAGKYGQLDTTVAPTGTLRVILRGGRVEVHYQIDDTAVRSAHRPCGTATVGVDGYSAHWRVKQNIQVRADRQRSRLQDSNTTDPCRCGERNIQSRSTPIKE
jgi:hypothetical protein